MRFQNANSIKKHMDVRSGDDFGRLALAFTGLALATAGIIHRMKSGMGMSEKLFNIPLAAAARGGTAVGSVLGDFDNL